MTKGEKETLSLVLDELRLFRTETKSNLDDVRSRIASLDGRILHLERNKHEVHEAAVSDELKLDLKKVGVVAGIAGSLAYVMFAIKTFFLNSFFSRIVH